MRRKLIRTRRTHSQPAPRLAAWEDSFFGELGLDGRSERTSCLWSSEWRTTLVRRGVQGRPVANVRVEVRTLGPFALRRTVHLKTADHVVRLELGRGPELGIGMPKRLRSATAFINDEPFGVLTIGAGQVALRSASGDAEKGVWRFAGRLLGYIGMQEPIVYGAVTWDRGIVGELLAPRLHTYDEALGRGGTPIWRTVAPAIDEAVRRWMLSLTALVLYCAGVGEEWHEHRPGRRND